MYSNFSNLAESGCLAANGPMLVHELIRHGQLMVVGERPTLIEFVESREPRYWHDAERYPMYFRKEHRFQEVRPRVLRVVSDTDNLQSSLESLAAYKTNLTELGLLPCDVTALVPHVSKLQELVQQRGSKGITRSLFIGQLQSLSAESAASRLISAIYIQRQLADLSADIVVGIQELVAFDRLCRGGGLNFDIRVLNYICRAAGFSALCLFDDQHDGMYAMLRDSVQHQRFASQVDFLCHAFTRVHGTDANAIAATKRSIQQAQIELRTLKMQASTLYEVAEQRLHGLARRLKNEPGFGQAYEEMMKDMTKATLLLVTATKAETEELLNVARSYTFTAPNFIVQAKYVAIEVGIVNGVRVLAVQCEPGSVGPSSSQAVITDAIRDLKPTAVILAGIAFGTKEDKQKLGDILVSKMVIEYEKAKVTEDGSLPRGQRIEASPKLLSVMRTADSVGLGNGVKVHTGIMLSGEKLIDSSAFRGMLLAQEPEAIGGEMEGAGLVAAASREKVDWIVVKAIVDWASKKESNNGPEHQKDIARRAMEFVLRAIAEIGL